MIVVADALAPGHAANAAAVLGITLGARVPELLGAPIIDGAGRRHPGLFAAGLPVLRGGADALTELHRRATAAAAAGESVGVIAFPTAAHQTNDYEQFLDRVAATDSDALRFAGLLVCGDSRRVRKLTGSFGLLR